MDNDMDNRELGALIARRRKALGLTQRELAEQLHVTDRAVSRWERGIGYPDVSLIVPLAHALSISTDELLTGMPRRTAPLPPPPLPSTAMIPHFYFNVYRAVGLAGGAIEIAALLLAGVLPDKVMLAVFLLGAAIFLSAIFVVYPLLYRCPGCRRFLWEFNTSKEYAQHCSRCGKRVRDDRSVSTLREYLAYRKSRQTE